EVHSGHDVPQAALPGDGTGGVPDRCRAAGRQSQLARNRDPTHHNHAPREHSMTQLTNGTAEKAAFRLPTPKEHLSSPVTRNMVRVQQKIVASAREFLGGEGFMEFLP